MVALGIVQTHADTDPNIVFVHCQSSNIDIIDTRSIGWRHVPLLKHPKQLKVNQI